MNKPSRGNARPPEVASSPSGGGRRMSSAWGRVQALMHEATQLTRAGRLNEATAVLQRALGAAPTTVVAANDFVDVVDVDVDVTLVYEKMNAMNDQEFLQLFSEIKSFKTSNSKNLKWISENFDFRDLSELKLINLLSHKIIDVNSKTKSGDFILPWAAKKGQKEIVELLLKHPDIDVNAKVNNYMTILYMAAKYGSKEIVELLLKHPNIDVNAKVNDDMTVLYMAAKYGRKEIVELLLKHPNIDVNTKDHSDDSILCWAVKIDYIVMTELLLKHPNIDVNTKDSYSGSNVLSLAIKNKKTEMVELLKAHGAKP